MKGVTKRRGRFPCYIFLPIQLLIILIMNYGPLNKENLILAAAEISGDTISLTSILVPVNLVCFGGRKVDRENVVETGNIPQNCSSSLPASGNG